MNHEPSDVEIIEAALTGWDDPVPPEIPPAIAALDRIKKALAFYANPKSYDDFGVPKIPHEGHPGCKVPDLGRTAKRSIHPA